MSRVISPDEFTAVLRERLATTEILGVVRAVTGPGRSGAIAAAHASHITGLPFLPFGARGPSPVLIVDTAQKSGRTMRAAIRRYERMGMPAGGVVCFCEPPRVRFWYEAGAQEGGAA